MGVVQIDEERHDDAAHDASARANLLERALVRSGASMLIVDTNGRVIEAFGPVSETISARPGQQRWRVLDILPSGLSEPTSAAIARVAEGDDEVIIDGIQFEHQGTPHTTSLRAFALSTPAKPITIIFADWKIEPGATAIRRRADGAVRDRLSDLEDESIRLHASVNRAQAEHTAISRDQESMRAELNTVNHELQELSERLHQSVQRADMFGTDLDELLRTIPLGVAVLDANGIVRYFNEAIIDALVVNMLEVGHAINVVEHDLHGVDLANDIKRAVQTRVGYEREVRTTSGCTHLMIIEPFVRSDGSTGVVLSTRDITRARDTHARLSTFARAFAQSHRPLLFAEPTGRIVEANPAFYAFTKLRCEDVEGADVRSLLSNATDPTEGRGFFDALDYGDGWEGELSLKGGIATPTACTCSVRPLRSTSGRLTEFVLELSTSNAVG